MAPLYITDLAGAIHTPLHITRITKVVKPDNLVNPDICRCQPELTCRELPSHLRSGDIECGRDIIASLILREQAGGAKGNTLEAASRYAPELVMPV